MTKKQAELVKLENIVKERGFTLRYEKGSFDSGHCIVNEKKIIIINKFFRLPARIDSLTEIVEKLNLYRAEEENTEQQLELEALTVA